MGAEKVTAYRVYYIRLDGGHGEIGPCFASKQLADELLRLLRTTSPENEMPVIKLTETKVCELFDAGEDFSEAEVDSFLTAELPTCAKDIEDALESFGVIVEYDCQQSA